MPRKVEISTASHAHVEAIALADYQQKCISCGALPTAVLTDSKRKQILYKSHLCGVCLWGEAACINPDEWSSGTYQP